MPIAIWEVEGEVVRVWGREIGEAAKEKTNSNREWGKRLTPGCDGLNAAVLRCWVLLVDVGCVRACAYLCHSHRDIQSQVY